MKKENKIMKENKNCKRLMIFGMVVVAVFIIASLATSASAEIIEVSQPTQVTSDSYYERGHSLCYNGSSYWMFYGRSTEDNQPYASCNPDDSNYELYYKQASSISGLASATATQLGSITDVYQGQTSCAYYDNEVWVFYADSSNNIEYFTYNTSWTGPTDTGFDGNGAPHLWVAEYNGNLHIVYNGNNGTDNVLLGRYYNGSSWSSADQASTNEGMPRLYNDTNGDLYLTWCSWGMPAYYIHKYDDGWSTTENYSITGTANLDCDPWLFENSDGNYSLMFAPWDGTQQSIAQWTASTLSGLDSATDHMVTQGSYTTSNPWVDMWPTVIDDGSDQYLFLTSERNPSNVSNETAGNIWYMKIDWNMSHDHYTYIQNAIEAATGTTINIAVGIYTEQVRIDKNVTVIGESESGVIINPDGLEFEGPRAGVDKVRAVILFETGCDNAVLQNVTIANNGYASDLNGNSGIEIIDGDIDNVRIQNVTVTNVSGHGFGSYHTDHTWPPPAGWIIENCSFSTSNTSTWSGMRPQNMDNLTIQDCDIGPTNYGGILLINTNDTAVVQRCTIHDTVRAGIQVDSYCTGTVDILDNEIWATNSAQSSDYGDVRLYGQYFPDPHGDVPATVTIQGNLLRDSYNGVCVKSGQNISTRTVMVHWNNIMSHSNYGVLNAGIGMLDATLNYWGDATGPYHSTNIGGLGDNVSDNVDFYPWIGGDPPWDVTLNLKEDGSAQIWDTAVFGEKIDASDDQDSYDVPKPGFPPSPYINGWFDADLSAPYNRLWKDYRHFPAENIWDLYVQANTNSGTTDVNISWNTAEIDNSEYGYVGLYDEAGTTFLADMTTSTNYVLTGAIDNIPYHLKIKCRILGFHQVSIKTKWNLISIPCYENISKNNIIIRNNSIEYNWTTAVNEGIVLDYIYKWNTTTGYGDTSTLEPGLGYWIWTYYDCELLIPSNAVGTGDITDMQQKWNIMGLPYTTSLDKEDLIVHYNGTDYSWENATSNNNPTGGPIILGFIYGWDGTNQIYILSDEFDPGYGYWMYAYYKCTLKK